MSNTASTIKPAGPTLARALKRQPFRVIDGHSAHDYDEASTLVVKPPGDVRFEPPGDPGESLGEAAYMVPEATDDPHRLARAVLARYTHSDGLTLAHYRGEFYVYDGTAYRLEPEFTSRALVKLVKEAVDIQHRNGLKASRSRVGVDAQKGASDGRHRPKTVPKVSKRLIGDVAQALESMVPIDSYQEAPFWRFPRPGDPDPINLLAARNGLVDLSNDRPVLWPHTPRFFSTHVLPFGYDPAARPPETWIRFLNDQWGDDPESIESLHEVMGYLLTPGTRQHKMFLLIGPPRSVRSTMKEIITALIGERNVAPTSAIALAGAFGLEPLLGKTVAVMADARTGGDTSAMMDRLLRIIGCDPVEVNRKGRPILPGVRMHVRFILVSNELPNFRDASNAITARYLVLRTTKTVPPERRDTDLMEKLGAELPGSLNLAIEGRRRLRERGRFLQPESAADLIETAEDLASPVKECVRECFVLREGAIICKATAFRIWREWAEAHGERVGDAATLGKSLFAAFSGLRATRPESTATRSTPMRESKPGVPDDGRLSTGAADARRA